ISSTSADWTVLQVPGEGDDGVVLVAAVRAGGDAVVEVRGQVGLNLGELVEGVPDRAGHTRPGPLRARTHLATAAREADGALQLRDQVLAIALGQRHPLRIVHQPRIVDVVVDLGETAPVRLPGRVVQHRQTRLATVSCGT